MRERFQLRAYEPADAEAVNATVVAAFGEFDPSHGDWPTALRNAAGSAALADVGEMIVATVDGKVVGCITYVGPGVEKQSWFEREWPVIRRLAVRPELRGLGIGRALTEECIARARRDGADLIALHTTPIMDVAVGMYERIGFSYLREAPPVGDVPYGIWAKRLR